jgi:hypothetical protein
VVKKGCGNQREKFCEQSLGGRRGGVKLVVTIQKKAKNFTSRERENLEDLFAIFQEFGCEIAQRNVIFKIFALFYLPKAFERCYKGRVGGSSTGVASNVTLVLGVA